MKTIPYCPISREQFKAMKKLLTKEEIGNVLREVCEYFFAEDDYKAEFGSRTELAYYDLCLDFAEEKHDAWERQRSNFTRNNPRKAKKQDPGFTRIPKLKSL